MPNPRPTDQAMTVERGPWMGTFAASFPLDPKWSSIFGNLPVSIRDKVDIVRTVLHKDISTELEEKFQTKSLLIATMAHGDLKTGSSINALTVGVSYDGLTVGKVDGIMQVLAEILKRHGLEDDLQVMLVHSVMGWSLGSLPIY
ncbi:hypothetical protein CGLO_15323 [Colletotrichum gloeosporioides Cg-14]|uniref:Uncharacterized protein n=1 Tax=Colletotrichum gloeosporioides (strain Cg-14) TaxID=1237896 RepID=T0L2A3_COLGC|nr:hypothetical protein CGLO_15323 [Colletotrichum gloeosporioides Cg-14]